MVINMHDMMAMQNVRSRFVIISFIVFSGGNQSKFSDLIICQASNSIIDFELIFIC